MSSISSTGLDTINTLLKSISSNLSEKTTKSNTIYDVLYSFYAEKFDNTLSDIIESRSAFSTAEYNLFKSSGDLSDELTEFVSAISTASETSTDSSALLSSITDFVETYNESIASLRASTYADAQTSADAMAATATKYSDELESYGILVDSDGTLSIDSEKLADAIESDPEGLATTLKTFLAKINSRAETDLASVLDNPITTSATSYSSSASSTVGTLLDSLL